MAETTTPPEAPPSSTRPVAKTLTPAELSRELSKPSPQQATPGPDPKPVAPADKKSEVMPGLLSKMRERLTTPKTGEGAPPEKKEATPPKAEPEKKAVVQIDDAPPKPVASPKADDAEIPADQLQVQPHDKPETARRIKQLLSNEAKLKRELEGIRAEHEKLSKAAPTAANTEELAKLKAEHEAATTELTKFRRRYEIDADPEFKAKYEEPVTQAESSIEATLKKHGLGDPTLKAIKDAGGFAAFSRSTQTFPIQEQYEEDGEKKARVVHVSAAELARNWLAAFPVADAELIRQAVGKQEALGGEKRQAIERAVGESKEFFEARKAEETKKQQAAAATANEIAQAHAKWVKETTEGTDWMKDRPVPDNATPEQTKEITEHNEFNKQLRDRLAKNPANREEYEALLLDSIHAHHLRRESGAKDATIARLEAEVARLKGGMRTTSKGGSLLQSKTAPKEESSDTPKDPMAALKERMRAKLTGPQDE